MASRSSPTTPRLGSRTRLRTLVDACRPQQWSKNLLVLAVPAAAGELGDGSVLVDTAVALVAFTLVSSGTYLLNDAADRDADQRHPVKRGRAIAAGDVALRTAVVVGVLLLLAGLGAAAAVGLDLVGVLALYIALTAAYTRGLKHVAVFDIAIVASGFFLRAVAGGVAADLPVSRWFLIVTASGSLFVTIGKRYAEKTGAAAELDTRRVLAQYSAEYLRSLLSTSAGVLVLAYCLWAFEGRPQDGPSGWTALSAVPFALGVMRYGLLVDHGHGEEPERLLLKDRQLQLLVLAWLVLILIGVVA